MDTRVDTKAPALAAKPVAPEDLQKGDYVAVTHVTLEYVAYWCEETWQHASPVRRARVKPKGAGRPYKVLRVCVPFVLVRDPLGKHHTLDLRRHEVARLDRAYARKAFECLKVETPAKA